MVEEGRMPGGFGLPGIPTTWKLDRDGRVVLRHQGVGQWDADAVRIMPLTLAGGGETAYNSAETPRPRPD
jgi:hypothetical protein